MGPWSNRNEPLIHCDSLEPQPGYIEFGKIKQPKRSKREIFKSYETRWRSDFSLSVLLISAHYLYAARKAEIRWESREALSGDGFHALRDSHFNEMI
jgi:hypothetical protein